MTQVRLMYRYHSNVTILSGKGEDLVFHVLQPRSTNCLVFFSLQSPLIGNLQSADLDTSEEFRPFILKSIHLQTLIFLTIRVTQCVQAGAPRGEAGPFLGALLQERMGPMCPIRDAINRSTQEGRVHGVSHCKFSVVPFVLGGVAVRPSNILSH